jgi:hypothetical protein
MPYEEFKVVNLALGRIGVKKITEVDWGDPVTQQAIDATAVWEFMRDEVLEARQWRFAKKRVQLILKTMGRSRFPSEAGFTRLSFWISLCL